MRALFQTPLKTLGVRVGDAADDTGTKFSVRKAILDLLLAKKREKASPSKKVAHEMPEKRASYI